MEKDHPFYIKKHNCVRISLNWKKRLLVQEQKRETIDDDNDSGIIT
ncbi:MAG: hypothetical protein ACFFAN_00945 [Promethearchaeota archaeon]